MSHSSNHSLFQKLARQLSYKKAVAITPHNTNHLAQIPDAIVSETDGPIAMTLFQGGDVTMQSMAGFPLKVSPIIIKATGTEATGIVALYT